MKQIYDASEKIQIITIDGNDGIDGDRCSGRPIHMTISSSNERQSSLECKLNSNGMKFDLAFRATLKSIHFAISVCAHLARRWLLRDILDIESKWTRTGGLT